MSLLRNILYEMRLLESVSVDEVSSAIDDHERIIINYHTKGEDKHTGARVIEVYAYGLTKTGNPVIRAFEPYGDTTTKVPRWKFFRLDRISSWKPTGQKFTEPASNHYRGLGDFNPDGDETMSVVYKIASFDGQEVDLQLPDNGPKKKEDDVYKTDTEKNLDRIRQQFKNPIKLSDLQSLKNQQKTDDGFKGVEIKTPEPGPKLKQDTEPEVYKTDTERGLENLKQQLQNPRKIDLSQFNKKDVDDLRSKLGDTSEPITKQDLEQRLSEPAKPQEPDVYKTDTERGLEQLRNQLKNPRKIDLSRISRR